MLVQQAFTGWALSQLLKKPFENVASNTKYLGQMDDAEDNGYNKSG